MRYAEIARLFEAPPPPGVYVSLYVATGQGRENAPHEMSLRWKNTRHALGEDGVPEPTLAAVDSVVLDPMVNERRVDGPTLAVLAADGRARWTGGLPQTLPREVVVRSGPLPDVLPLLAAAQTQVPHLAVLTDRTGAEIAARVPNAGVHLEEQVEQVEGERSPAIHRSAPGGWSQRRYQQRAEVKWDQNASLVVEVLAKLADRVRPRFVAVAGDVRALQFLRDNAPKRLRDLLQVVGGEYRSLDTVFEQADRLMAETAAADTSALLARFTQEHEQGDRALGGAAATLAALGRGQVETLLVCDEQLADRTAWFGPSPNEVALDRDPLTTAGVDPVLPARLADVAVRAALHTGAEIRVLTATEATAVPEGVGALLRYPAASS